MARFLYIVIFGGIIVALLGSLSPVQAYSKEGLMEDVDQWLSQTQSRTDLLEIEKDLRIEFIYRLKFEIQQKYSDQNLRDFLKSATQNILLTDKMPENRSLSRLIPYLENLLEAQKTMIESRENPLQFIIIFTEYSSISAPLLIAEFGRTRDYSNGTVVLQASPLSLSEAADFAEEYSKNSLLPQKPLLFDRNLLLEFDLS